jgi:hypothetical protein
VELVGNRYSLTRRQRVAVARCACTDEEAERRQQRQVRPEDLQAEELWLDGFNVLTVLESALGGGVVLLGRDGCCRDVAGLHRRYRKVEETIPALRLLGEMARDWGVAQCRWWLDKPVSNSGRLKALLLDVAEEAGWNWQAELVPNPDYVLSHATQIVATSDSVVLDNCQRWFNCARLLIDTRVPQAHVLDFKT